MTKRVSIFPLGGMDEIGKNMYVIEYENEMVVIDCGRKFADEEHPGVDSLIPDIRYLMENKEKVKGIFITHGHEDHIGALPYVLPRLNVPVYGAPLTIGLVRSTLQEFRLLRGAQLKEVNERSYFRFDCLSVSFFRTTHSIPDSLGIVVHTPEGAVVHTGDFKFDLTPVGPTLDFSDIVKVGKRGVLALLSDSTNSERTGSTPSEETVGTSIEKLFRKTRGRIFFSTFASNVYRLQQVVETAHLYGRKLAILGFSMEKAFRISESLGHLKIPENLIIDAKDLPKYKAEKVVVLCTGSQGEPRAALSRIATGAHPTIQVQPGDTVILSSSPIPGNTRRIYKTINRLFRAGAEVIHGSQVDIHASGHGSQHDQQMMLRLIRPRYFIPIHGEYRMLVTHAKLAEQTGVKPENIFILDNGETVHLTRRKGIKKGRVPTDLTVVDKNGIEENFSVVLQDRKRLSENGLVMVVLAVNRKTLEVKAGPDIITRGFVYVRESEELIQAMKREVQQLLNELRQNNGKEPMQWKAEIIWHLNRFLSKKIQRHPLIFPVISYL
ncbi:ribonuclease J [Paludifilum halophilum]|uniref:Ribonuclease J n=1 Tax=Paludifilum halophilum TaxID=1642702 RepID=A0A235B854_9BACL|nr:ribonuclease J [Paludifilum halophilum]OYD08490.1 ribonuclease J [Paludifilum halophilum]